MFYNCYKTVLSFNYTLMFILMNNHMMNNTAINYSNIIQKYYTRENLLYSRKLENWLSRRNSQTIRESNDNRICSTVSVA